MRITVLGAGSWGTTVATLVSKRNATVLWARDAELAREIREEHTNSRYLEGYPLPGLLEATSDLEEAVADTDLLIVGIPTSGVRAVIEQAAKHLRPWIPVVSLSK